MMVNKNHPPKCWPPAASRVESFCGRFFLPLRRSILIVAGFIWSSQALGNSTSLLVADSGGLDLTILFWIMAGVVALLVLMLIPLKRLNGRLSHLAEAREQARQALAESESRYRLLAENATDVIWTATWPDLRVTYASPSVRRLLGLSPEELKGTCLYDRIAPTDHDRLARAVASGTTQPAGPGLVEMRLLDVKGAPVIVETVFNWTSDENGQIDSVQGSSRDITRRKRIENDRKAREAILSGLSSAARNLLEPGDRVDSMGQALAALGQAVEVDRVYVFENHVDEETGKLLASQRFEWVGEGIEPQIDNPDMQSMSYEDVIPNWYPVLAGGKVVHGLVREMGQAERRLLESQGILSIVVVPIMLEGKFWGQIGFDDCSRQRRWGQAEIDALRIAAGTIGGGIRSMYAEQELQYLADTDTLTGVRSRRAFLERAEEAFKLARQTGRAVSLLIMDIDRFKWVNDTYGHPVGDEALKEFTLACAEELRSSDIMGRMGGEEFAIVLVGVGSEGARALAERLRKRVAETPVSVQSECFFLTVSIGVAILEDSDAEFLSLLKRADKALYQAKNQGRDRVEILN